MGGAAQTKEPPANSADGPVAAPAWVTGQTNCATCTRTTGTKHTTVPKPTPALWQRRWHPSQNKPKRNETITLSHRKLYQIYLKFFTKNSHLYNVMGTSKFHPD